MEREKKSEQTAEMYEGVQQKHNKQTNKQSHKFKDDVMKQIRKSTDTAGSELLEDTQIKKHWMTNKNDVRHE